MLLLFGGLGKEEKTGVPGGSAGSVPRWHSVLCVCTRQQLTEASSMEEVPQVLRESQPPWELQQEVTRSEAAVSTGLRQLASFWVLVSASFLH